MVYVIYVASIVYWCYLVKTKNSDNYLLKENPLSDVLVYGLGFIPIVNTILVLIKLGQILRNWLKSL